MNQTVIIVFILLKLSSFIPIKIYIDSLNEFICLNDWNKILSSINDYQLNIVSYFSYDKLCYKDSIIVYNLLILNDLFTDL